MLTATDFRRGKAGIYLKIPPRIFILIYLSIFSNSGDACGMRFRAAAGVFRPNVRVAVILAQLGNYRSGLVNPSRRRRSYPFLSTVGDYKARWKGRCSPRESPGSGMAEPGSHFHFHEIQREEPTEKIRRLPIPSDSLLARTGSADGARQCARMRLVGRQSAQVGKAIERESPRRALKATGSSRDGQLFSDVSRVRRRRRR